MRRSLWKLPERKLLSLPYPLLIRLPALIAHTVRSSVAWGVEGARGLVGGIIGGAIVLGVTVPVVLLVLLILVPVMLLVLLIVGAALVAALAGWPLESKPKRRYLRWEHWDELDGE